jgi:hypothetical protein
MRRHLPLVFQTLAALDKNSNPEDAAVDTDRIKNLREHLVRLGKAESKLTAGFRERNGGAERPGTNGVPSTASAPLAEEQRKDLVAVLRVSRLD